MLEKREFYYDDEDHEKTGKAKGFTKDDFEQILKYSDEILKLLGQEDQSPARKSKSTLLSSGAA